ncbi:MAG TPA: peroxiredoxin [Myxococcales bacterium]|jgi:peroxiredoxin Q/BCP|nr:peroxiredoxin [Myxococcales bacterium]
MALTVGTKAPDFKLPSTEGRTVSLKELKGKKVVLYFYPKDDTPGCTREACDFRDNLARVKSQGALVYGVSKDTIASHDKFREKYELPYPLLSDEGNETAKEYEAFGEKTLYGRKSMGTIRSTYLIGEDGKIAAVWSPVKVDGHVDKVLAALKGEAADEPTKADKPAKAAAKSPKKK